MFLLLGGIGTQQALIYFHARWQGWFGVYQSMWMSLTRVNISSLSWIFAHMENNEPMPHFQMIFEFLRYWGLWFNWNMRNAFTFNSQVGVRKYVVKLNVLLLCQLAVLEKSRNLNHEERELRKVIYHHILHLNWCVGVLHSSQSQEYLAPYKGSILCTKLVMVVYFFFRNESYYLQSAHQAKYQKLPFHLL